MHDKLREGDIDPRCIEGLLHADVKVILRIEVFRTFYGSADIDADGGVSHAAHIDGELFLIDHIRILCEYLFKELHTGFQIRVIADIEGHLQISGIIGRKILDDAARQRGIRDDDALISQRRKHGVHDADLRHCALIRGDLDVVTHTEGAEDENENAGGYIADIILEPKTDRQTHAAESSRESPCTDACRSQSDQYDDGQTEEENDLFNKGLC